MSELEQTLIPCGLHVLGEGMTAEARADTIAAMVDGTPLSVLSRTAVDALVAGGSTDVVMAESGLASTPANVALLEELAQTNRHLQENQELPALMHALDAGFVRPAPGGDLLRTPTILPTGRNVHGFDPFAIPSAFAILDGAEQAARLLARHVAEGNALPESVALVLWGTDNLKSGGGPIGQALALLGARPRFDSYGRLCGAALMPLEELGRPRIDVLITVSGIFRDLLPLQTRLLAEAALLASAADEPLELNFVRRHTLAHQKSHGCDLETAALRVFSNADGAYGANVNHLIDAGTWENEDELGDAFARRKSFAYGIKGPPVRHDGLLKSVLAGVELTYQNVESVELGVTSLDQYFDALGGMTRAATRERGTAPAVYIGDQTHGAAKVRTLNEQVALETRTRSLNPRWSEEMLKHGAEGVRHIEAQITNTLGWSATTGRVDAWVYRELTTTYLLDPAMRARLAALNPKAASKLAQRLIEASDRSYWSPDADMLAAMHDAADEIEDRLEGVTRPIPSAATAAETSPSTVSTSTATRVEPRAQAFGLSLDNAHAA
jgi:magnesium chelatase subunit H